LQEFFERKRFGQTAPTAFSGKTSKRRKVSQDIMALHTVSRTHSTVPIGSV